MCYPPETQHTAPKAHDVLYLMMPDIPQNILFINIASVGSVRWFKQRKQWKQCKRRKLIMCYFFLSPDDLWEAVKKLFLGIIPK